MKTVDEELWLRAQARREDELGDGMVPADRLLLPLVLSLARLAAQRDAQARNARAVG